MSVFKVGDVVNLKSGGATMTVQHVEDARSEGFGVTVTCGWHDKTHKLNVAGFPADMLELDMGPAMPFSV